MGPHDRSARFIRLVETSRPPVTIEVDGEPITAFAGDSVLTAILAHKGYFRDVVFDDDRRAGACVIGACPDCLVWTVDGDKLHACTTEVVDGLAVVTVLPDADRCTGGRRAPTTEDRA
jgi:predicted molibdopterin-dependent oxidoreductase YjgC